MFKDLSELVLGNHFSGATRVFVAPNSQVQWILACFFLFGLLLKLAVVGKRQ